MQADEFFLELQVEPLDEGGYVATSGDFPGLVPHHVGTRPLGTLRSIIRQTGSTVEEFFR